MDEIYRIYANYIRTNFDLTTFKSHQDYTYMLEHVSYEQGVQYFDLIKNECQLNNHQIVTFCEKNDSIGNPIRYDVRGITCSPTSLRYLYHAYRIIFLLKNCRNIIEVGGGYGGLLLAIDYLSNIFGVQVDNYSIIDLEDALKVQQLYTSNFKVNFNVQFLSAFDYIKYLNRNDYFLVSNYCISEIGEANRELYKLNLIPKIERGFLTWNHIDFDYNMFKDFQVSIETERPLTGHKNLYVILVKNLNVHNS